MPLRTDREVQAIGGISSPVDGLTSLLSSVVNNSDDAIISKTLEGIITSWNPAAERMFGYTPAEAIGKSIRMIIPAELQAEEDFVLGQIRKAQKVDHFETVRQAKNGERLNISLTVSPIKDAQGTIVGASKIARDITYKKRIEREREELLNLERAAREQLAEAVRARDEFIAIAAHELRNPLNVFQLSLQLMHRVLNDPKNLPRLQSLIEKSQFQLTRLNSLVDRLLDVSRLRSGTFDLYRERFDLCALIREVATRFRTGNPTLELRFELPPDLHGNWDRIRIDQVLVNLLSNAIKFGQDRPVVVTAALEGQLATVTVCDQGVGISKENLERIFDQFERASQQTGNEGLGLGLWITRRIVESHGGTIEALSQPSQGSTFIVRLPIQ